MIGITFKGIHSSDYKLVWQSISRPVLPALKPRETKIPFKHGVYDFGNNDYDTRQITGKLQFIGLTVEEMRSRLRSIAKWLYTTQFEKLVFDDESGKYYLARVKSVSNLETAYRTGIIDVIFDCQPFAVFLYSSIERVQMIDAHIKVQDARVLIAGYLNFQFTVTETASFDFINTGTVETNYKSPQGTKFNITIVGRFIDISITLNGKLLTYSNPISNQTLIIKSVDMEVELDGSNSIACLDGDIETFLEVIPGANVLQVSGTDLDCTVNIDFDYLYL